MSQNDSRASVEYHYLGSYPSHLIFRVNILSVVYLLVILEWICFHFLSYFFFLYFIIVFELCPEIKNMDNFAVIYDFVLNVQWGV